MQNPSTNKINHCLWGGREGLHLVGDVSFTEQKLFRNMLSVACLSEYAWGRKNLLNISGNPFKPAFPLCWCSGPNPTVSVSELPTWQPWNLTQNFAELFHSRASLFYPCFPDRMQPSIPSAPWHCHSFKAVTIQMVWGALRVTVLLVWGGWGEELLSQKLIVRL